MHIRSVVVAALLLLGGLSLRGQSPADLPRVQASDVTYLGAFTVPGHDGSGADTGALTYGGNALGVSSDGKTLYIGCHDWYSRLAQVSIPAIGGTAQVVTRCTAIPRLDQVDPGSGSSYKLGGSLQWNGRTIIAGYSFYDGDANQRASHFVGSTNLTGITGPSAMTVASGFVSGYMGVIPQEWRSAFGGPAFTGFCCGAILSRTSNGPTATVFNPDDVGRANPIQATQVLAYPLDHAPGTDVFSNAGDNVVGVAFPAGTRSVLFIGLKATGRYCYGTGQECGDPSSNWKGPHGYPYYHEIWAYDANDLVAVKNGQKQPWDPRPYAHIRLKEMNNSGGAKIRGAAYDPTSKRLYITEDYGDSPRVHVYEIAVGSSAPPPPAVEVCGDGIDNDGDGQVDEGCAPPPPTSLPIVRTFSLVPIAENRVHLEMRIDNCVSTNLADTDLSCSETFDSPLTLPFSGTLIATSPSGGVLRHTVTVPQYAPPVPPPPPDVTVSCTVSRVRATLGGRQQVTLDCEAGASGLRPGSGVTVRPQSE